MILVVTKGDYVADSVASAEKGCECKTAIFYLCYSDVNQ